MDYLLGIDAGTTSVKAGLFASDGRLVALCREEYQLETPSPEWVQLNPQVYWQACVRTVRGVLAESGIDPAAIRALGVSSQGETTITLDAQGEPLYPAMIWLDNRAGPQAAKLASAFADRIYDITGVQELIPTWTACKILWLRENEPALFERAWKFMLVQDYLVYRLSGRAVTDGSIACTTLLYDIRRHVWWDEMLAAVGIASDRLPEILPPGAQVGTLTPAAAEALGLDPRMLVVNGGMDQSTGAIGAGNIAPGTISESTGGALVIQAPITDPGLDKSKVIPVYCHSLPGLYLFAPVCPTAGMALKWLRDTFFQPEIQSAVESGLEAYDLMTLLAESVPPGADGLVMLPHLMGAFSPLPNPAARGAFSGFSLSHGRGHFVRAVLEGVAFMLRQNLDTLKDAGLPVHELRSTGGGSRSPLWNQIKADVCRVPVITLAAEDTALLGDAILAGVACGVFATVEQGCREMVLPKRVFMPGDPVDLYEAPYRRYVDLDRSLAPHFRRSYAS